MIAEVAESCFSCCTLHGHLANISEWFSINDSGMGVGYNGSYAFLRACTENWVGQFLSFCKARVNDLLTREIGQVCLPVRASLCSFFPSTPPVTDQPWCVVLPVEASDLGIVTWVLLT